MFFWFCKWRGRGKLTVGNHRYEATKKEVEEGL